MGRPPIGSSAMTGTERVRRYRERQRPAASPPRTQNQQGPTAAAAISIADQTDHRPAPGDGGRQTASPFAGAPPPAPAPQAAAHSTQPQHPTAQHAQAQHARTLVDALPQHERYNLALYLLCKLSPEQRTAFEQWHNSVFWNDRPGSATDPVI